MAVSKADRERLGRLTYEGAQQWTKEQLAKGASVQELRTIARSYDRPDGPIGVVDAVLQITG